MRVRDPQKVAAIIAAGGAGRRMGPGEVKQLRLLCGKPVLFHTLRAFERHAAVDAMVVVAPPERLAQVGAVAAHFPKVTQLVAGGLSRQASVYAGLCAAQDAGLVLIHDGARPLVSERAISDVLDYARRGLCAVSGVLAKDTVKRANADGTVRETLSRGTAWLAQTPQGFPYNLIAEAHEHALQTGFEGTDDSVLAERIGQTVHMVPGDYHNIKITTPEDFALAELFIKMIFA